MSSTLSPSPPTPLCAPPAVTHSHSLSITHDYTCPHAQLSLVHTMAGRTQGLPVGQGGETRPGTPPCLGPCPLRLLGPQPPHRWSTWTFSRMDVSLEPLLQSGFSPQPLLFFPYRRRQPGPCPSESLYSGVSLLWVHCRVQPTAPRWSQGDMQLLVHTGPQESTPTSTVDRAGLRIWGGAGRTASQDSSTDMPEPVLPSSHAEDMQMRMARSQV
ncbi:uncharacterized protein [Bos indicus]|uniref:Uncharacterized protein n=1 Tax=Bos indicus TaxID=9915 RepID=A0ABM4SJG7_BOSIN